MATTGAAQNRRRLSAWTTIDNFLDAAGGVDPKAFVDRGRPDPAKPPIIDDLALLRTISEVPKDPAKPVELGGELTVQFDPFPNANLGGHAGFEKDDSPDTKKAKLAAYDAKQSARITAILDHCHQVLGIQCLVGFTHMDSANTQIEAWLNLPVQADPVGKPSGQWPRHDAFCDEIIGFCEKRFPGYDGISFDLEGIRVIRFRIGSKIDPAKEPDFPLYQASLQSGEEKERLDTLGHQELDFLTWRVTTNLTRLYTSLGTRLSSPILRRSLAGKDNDASDRGWDRIVAFAGSGLIGALPQPPDPADKTLYKSRLLEWKDGEIVRRGTHDFETKKHETSGKEIKPLPAEAAFRMHDYFGMRHSHNVIIRPMAYDNFDFDAPRTHVDGWHADIVRYIRRVMNLHPGNFQLGVKTFPGDNNKPSKSNPKGRGGMMTDPKWVKQRCTDLLAPEDLGICLFQASQMFWKDANDGLNPTNPEAGHAGQPVQVPLNAKAAAFYNPPKPTP